MSEKVKKCCGAMSKNMHMPSCKEIPIEELKQYYYRLYEADSERNLRESRRNRKISEVITFWQGKYQIVKTENNALRKKLKED